MKKKAHYRRAVHTGGELINLQTILALCPTNYPNRPVPVFDYTAELECAIVSHVSTQDYEEVHLAVFERGSSAAIVEVSQMITVGEIPPPSDNEFIKHQIFLLISRNDIIFATHNQPIRDTRINAIVQVLINQFCGVEHAPNFRFEAVLDEEVYRRMMADGIGEIDMGVSVFSQALERATIGGVGEASLVEKVLGAVGMAMDGDPEVYGKLVLRSGAKWENPSIQRAMQSTARRLIDDGDSEGFKIVTKSGITITEDAIRLTNQFEVHGNSQIVDVRQLATGLREAYSRFSGLGVLGEFVTIVEDPN